MYKSATRDVLAYKLRHVGLREMLYLGYLHISEAILFRANQIFPSLIISPRSIQIETTTRCNLKCTHCEISYWTEPAADLKLPDFERILNHLPKLKRVELTGIGEPFMNRDFFDIVALLKARNVRISMTDNFTMMTEKVARRIIELGVDRIAISLDGATKETFEKVRVGSNFEMVTRNVRRLVELQRELGRRKPEILINFVVTADSFREAPAIVDVAHELGVRVVQLDCVKTFDKTENLATNSEAAEFSASLDKAFERALVHGIIVKWMYFEQNVPIEQCTRAWNRNFVTRDGYVHPCCLTTQTGDRAAQNRRSLGNLVDSPFEEIWNSAAFTTLRKNMKDGVLPYACHQCPSYTGRPDPVGEAQAAAWQPARNVSPAVFIRPERGAEESVAVAD